MNHHKFEQGAFSIEPANGKLKLTTLENKTKKTEASLCKGVGLPVRERFDTLLR